MSKFELDFYYGYEALQFRFLAVPKALLEDEKFSDLSIPAKVLYSAFLERLTLSMQNNWVDDNGRIYIIFDNNEIRDLLNISANGPTRLMHELQEFGLVSVKRQGLSKPNLIYVKKFISAFGPVLPPAPKPRITKKVNQESPKGGIKNHQIGESGPTNSVNQESPNPCTIDTNINNLNIDTNVIDQSKQGQPQFICDKMTPEQFIKLWNDIEGVVKIQRISAGSVREKKLLRLLTEYSVDDIKMVIEKVRQSEYLIKQNPKFDWMLDNVDKILEGNYDKKYQEKQEKVKTDFSNYHQRNYDYSELEKKLINKTDNNENK